MRSKNIRLRPFTDNFDIFSSCSNPRHVSCMDASSVHNTVSLLPTSSVLLNYPIRFSSKLPSSPLTLLDYPLPGISVLPDEIVF